MLSYKALWLAFAALLVMSGTATGTAQAAPEFLHLGLPLTKTVAFTFKGGFGQFVLGLSKLTWSGVTGSGTIEAPNKVPLAEILFTSSKIGACAVHSPGAGGGEVVIKEVKGELGYLELATKKVGILFTKATELFVEVSESACNKPIVITGSVIGNLTPVNSETNKLIASFLLVGGKDQFTKFEGEAEEHVLLFEEIGGPEGEVGFECEKEELVTAEGVEVKA